MAAAEPHILCTAPLSDALVRQAADRGVHITVRPFIRVEPIGTEQLRSTVQRMAGSAKHVVFTSANAVEAVHALLPPGHTPAWTVHVVGTRTRELIAERSGTAAIGHTAQHADELVPALIGDGSIRSVAFFCGDQRLDTIPAQLHNAGIVVEEIVVYRTIATPQRSTARYDAVLFLSPSAVASYFSLNGWNTGTVPFAIGRTTAAALSHHAVPMAIMPATPTREALVAAVCDHFAIPSARTCT